jgi:transcriptional regulator with XRE-family HTH domain
MLGGMPEPGIAQTFGKVIRKHRLALKFSQEALAEKADLHPTYIGLVERGMRIPGLGAASRIARALGKQLSEIIAEAERA